MLEREFCGETLQSASVERSSALNNDAVLRKTVDRNLSLSIEIKGHKVHIFLNSSMFSFLSNHRQYIFLVTSTKSFIT